MVLKLACVSPNDLENSSEQPINWGLHISIQFLHMADFWFAQACMCFTYGLCKVLFGIPGSISHALGQFESSRAGPPATVK
jgi:hypothetical protein